MIQFFRSLFTRLFRNKAEEKKPRSIGFHVTHEPVEKAEEVQEEYRIGFIQ